MKSIVKLLALCCAFLLTTQLSAQTTASTQAKDAKEAQCKPADCDPKACTPEQMEWCKKNCKDASQCKGTSAKAVKASTATAEATAVVALFPDFSSKMSSSCQPKPTCQAKPACKASSKSVAKTEKKASTKLALASNKK